MKMLRVINQYVALITFLASLAPSVMAQFRVVDLKDFDRDRIYTKGFTVKKNTAVYIEATGVMSKSHKWDRWNPMFAYGWILNSDTREVVWAMTPGNVENSLGSPNVQYEGTITLKAGHYEAFFSTLGQRIIKIRKSNSYLNEFVRNLVKVFVDDADLWEDMSDWHLRIIAKEDNESAFGPWEEPKSTKAVVALIGARDSDYLEKGFTVDKDIKMKIYCNGEGQDDHMYDFGWVTNDKTARPVWEMQYDNTAYGGGAEKNRVYTGIITIPAGNYIATYVTDDSHSSNNWNMQPPYDPSRWGLTLSVLDEGDLEYIHDYKKAKRQEIISLTKIGDSDYRSEGFSLSKTTDLMIYALGEGRDNKMFDYGWITDAKSGERVWEMRYYETKSGGGDSKNRLYEGSLTLKSGDYIVHYVSDGSHSYDDWNADPPYNQSKWGITISLTSNDDAKNISKYNENEDMTILTKIVRVGDDEYLNKSFTLKNDSKIRITCLGEGKDRRMYDYGWIKDANTGQTVWEMTYGMTEHAGGGRKNRIFDGMITLEAGKYEVYYITDGSHSFEDWNDDPPAEPDKWGITIRLVK